METINTMLKQSSAKQNLSAICKETLESFREQMRIIEEKEQKEINNNKKDFYIENWTLIVMESQLKRSWLERYWLWHDRTYELSNKNIEFLWNNKYKITILWKEYWLPNIYNNPDINLVIQYNAEEWKVNYSIPWRDKWTIIISKYNILNSNTMFIDKAVKVKINFTVYGKDLTLVLHFPLKTEKENTDKLAA